MTLYSMLHTMVSPITKGMYRMRVIGAEHIPAAGKMILCSNHRSVMDPILLGVSVKKRPIRYMAKEELFVKHGKAVNRFLRTLGAFPVKRGSGDTKVIAYHAKAPVLPVGIDTNGDIKAWKPVTIRFGKPIAYEEFGFTDGSRKEMKYAAHIIAERVNQLLEAKE